MHKSILLFGLTIGLISPPASTQASVEKIAYDSCYTHIDGSLSISCNIAIANVDGTNAVYMPAEAYDPAWSPDGSRIAFATISGYALFIWNADDRSFTELPNSSYAWSPTWAPDGQSIAFASNQTGSAELFVSQAGGSATQLTDQDGFVGSPAWSPDGTRIAFDCDVAAGNRDICALELATGAITRLTTDLAIDTEPAWSPDGTRLAFSTTRFGAVGEIAIMNADGSAVSRLASGVVGQQPAWSPSGDRLAFVTTGGPCDDFGYCLGVINLVNIDGTGQTFFGYGLSAAWAASTAVFGRPYAWINVTCRGLTCSFSASGSWDGDGEITGYSWNFGDGGSGVGYMIDHTFPALGTYSVTLTVVDNEGLEGSLTTSVTVVNPPQAVAAVSCSGLTCSFDGSGSSDADGTIVNYLWSFGDGTQASGPVVTHTYSSGGSRQISLQVTDNSGASSATSYMVTVSNLIPLHVGDLDSSSASLRNNWTASVTITVHDANHQAMTGVTVSGTWSTTAQGVGSCITNGAGQCTIVSAQLKNSVASTTFTVGNLQIQFGAYTPAANHDPESDSNGTRITLRKK